MTNKNYHTGEFGIIFNSRYQDEHGNPVSRTKHEYPYSYDGFVTHRLKSDKKTNCTVYSDRIHCGEKYDIAAKKNFGNTGQMFFDRKPKDIEQFLRDYYDIPEIELTLVMEYCNVSSGFPLWRFDFYMPRNN